MSNITNPTDIRTVSFDAPAGAMAKGLAVVINGSTIAKCGDAARPYGFLLHNVTTDGPSWLELQNIPLLEIEEVKVSDGKVLVLLYEPGEICTDNVKSGETWAVGEKLACAANGELTNSPTLGDYLIGEVTEINVIAGGSRTMQRVTLSHDLGKQA